MDILVLSPTPSFPIDQGNRSRIANVCQYFRQRGARIHFLYFPREWGGRFVRQEYDGVAAQWDYFDVIPPSKDFVYMTDKADFGIDDWWDENIANHIKWKTNSYFYDAFIVNYAFFSKAFEYVSAKTLKILDTHDRLGGRRIMLANHGIPPDFFYTTIEEEKIALDRADAVIAITQSEAEYFRTLTNRPVLTVGHVCNRIEIDKVVAGDGVCVFGFLGSDNIVNVRNVLDFFKYFYERYPNGLAGTRFLVAGSCCNRLRQFANHPGVVMVGRVDGVDEFYKMVDCVFVPFMFGTGQKIKVVEALACGLPLIATASASDGIYSAARSHNCGSFVEIVDCMSEFVCNAGYRSALLAETADVFDGYCTRVGDALHALWSTIQQSRSCVLVDPPALYRILSGFTRAQVIDALVPLVSTLETLAEIIEITNKDQAMAALRLVSRSLLQPDEQLVATAAKYATKGSTEEGAGVIIALGDTGMLDADPLGKIMLSILTDTLDLAHPDVLLLAGSFMVMLRNQWPPKCKNVDAALKRMAPVPYERKLDKFDGVLFLVRKFDDPAIGEAVREIRALLGTVYRSSLPCALIDEDGTVLSYSPSGDPQIQVRLDDFYEVMMQTRAQAMVRNNIVVNVFLSYADLPSLFKILANDCGPMVSLCPTNQRVLGVDGEIITSSPRETAIRIATLAAAPGLCVELANRWRMSVASLISPWLFKQSVSKELAAIKDRQLNQPISGTKFAVDIDDKMVIAK